ncbi:hypothetical protein NIES2109_35510 [Nostoc sp. HK-01]|uniref:Uncharacterized protein n=1 Tax=Anabaenopsis circularis NIES-21 TaxID=1085406 RepID=A0A1Z4GCG4_9CYAN|nr:hypothetical protein NIES21_09840 [Anabaenopsis circularis NIES-21]BBD60752.1 hypothetical protein NIES2109_35510 [Nostoc sp. HK-01]
MISSLICGFAFLLTSSLVNTYLGYLLLEKSLSDNSKNGG